MCWIYRRLSGSEILFYFIYLNFFFGYGGEVFLWVKGGQFCCGNGLGRRLVSRNYRNESRVFISLPYGDLWHPKQHAELHSSSTREGDDPSGWPFFACEQCDEVSQSLSSMSIRLTLALLKKGKTRDAVRTAQAVRNMIIIPPSTPPTNTQRWR